jgi:adenylate cyclase
MPSDHASHSTTESHQRKLVAILSADVAGYSMLMGRDEANTVRTLSDYRIIIGASVERHSGKVNDAKGDAILAEFGSAVNAVECAVEIQRELARRNGELPDDRRMQFRIGINLGDVIVQDDTVYGDGVNVAARLEAIAIPGGICISRTVYDQVKTKLPLEFQSLGRKQLKNIAEPVEVFRVGGDSGRRRRGAISRGFSSIWWGQRASVLIAALLTGAVLAAWSVFQFWTPSKRTALELPAEPSLVVLPFSNFGGSAQDEYFIDGMTETLITDLSRLRDLFVIARNTSFTYKKKAVDVRQVGKELGVRYVVEGSVQRTTDRLRINVQLVEAESGRHVWAERYDRPLADLFEVQDDIADKIVTELEVKLLQGETARSWRKTTRDRAAYDLSMRGEVEYYKFTQEGIALAQSLFAQAVQRDPDFVGGIVWLGWTHYTQGDAGWSEDPSQSYRTAETFARKAIDLDPDFGDAYALLATVLVTLGRHDEALAAAETALALAPNQADTLVNAGWILAQNGRAEQAVMYMLRAFRLDPFPQDVFHGGLAESLRFAGRVKEAIPSYRKCVERIPDFIWCQMGLTVAYVEVGDLEQAAVHAREAQRINPKVTAEDNTYVRAIGDTAERRRVVQAFRKAGLK